MDLLIGIGGICFLLYLLYSWVEFYNSGRYKKMQPEQPIKRTIDGSEPDLIDVSLDISKKIIEHDFESKENV